MMAMFAFQFVEGQSSDQIKVIQLFFHDGPSRTHSDVLSGQSFKYF